jgi:ATP-dependent Lhr-like helicase
VAAEDGEKSGRSSLSRSAGSSVILVDGALAAYFRRRSPDLVLFLPEDEPARSRVATAVARKLAEVGAGRAQSRRSLFTIETVNQLDASQHPFAKALVEAGFFGGPRLSGYRFARSQPAAAPQSGFAQADFGRYQKDPSDEEANADAGGEDERDDA